jgi:tetratricopeptide (TPR) repeat protein
LVRTDNQNFPGPLTFSPDSRVLAVATSMWEVQLVDVATRREFATLTSPDRQWLHALSFSPDGSRLAVANGTDTILLWNLRLLREELQGMGLAGNWPEYPAPDNAPPQSPVQIQILPGKLSNFRQRPPSDQEARRYIQKDTEALAKEPSRIDLYEHRGACHGLLKEYDQAVADYQAALDLDPDRATTCNNLAWIYLTVPETAGGPEKALALAQRAVHLSPEVYTFRNTLGTAYYRMGQWSTAVEILQDAIAANSEGANAYDDFVLAMCYGKLGQMPAAQDHYEQALQWVKAQADLASSVVEELESFHREAATVLETHSP